MLRPSVDSAPLSDDLPHSCLGVEVRTWFTITLLTLLALAGCAETSVMPLSANRVQILVNADGDCGPTGAQDVAFQRAAAATIQRGFDRFIVVSTDRDSQQASSFFGSTTTATGTFGSSFGSALFWSEHQSIIVIEMFNSLDPGADDAIDARDALGPDWQTIVAKEGSLFSC